MSNMKFDDVNAFLKNVRKLGEDEGKGASSRAEFVVNVAIAAKEGHITDNKPTPGNPSDAEKVWLAFREGAAKKAGDVVSAEASHKQRVSNIAQIIKAAVLTGVELSDTLLDTRPILADAKAKGLTKSNTFDAFVDVARAQLKKGNTNLNRAEILDAICPKEKTKEYDEVIALEKLVADIAKVAKGTQPTETSPGKPAYPSEALSAAKQLLEDRITLIKFAAVKAHADAAALRAASFKAA